MSRQDLQKVFAGLLEYALYHFSTEEELMSRHGFPGLVEHKKEHDEFRKKITHFVDVFVDSDQNVALEMAEYLFTWIKLHVYLVDKQYSKFLNERGVH
jgi:hemerythrin-like metal-binding protein